MVTVATRPFSCPSDCLRCVQVAVACWPVTVADCIPQSQSVGSQFAHAWIESWSPAAAISSLLRPFPFTDAVFVQVPANGFCGAVAAVAGGADVEEDGLVLESALEFPRLPNP